MRSMFSIFAYYFAQVLIGVSPIRFSDEQCGLFVASRQ